MRAAAEEDSVVVVVDEAEAGATSVAEAAVAA
jgi:hypothetical protein